MSGVSNREKKKIFREKLLEKQINIIERGREKG